MGSMKAFQHLLLLLCVYQNDCSRKYTDQFEYRLRALESKVHVAFQKDIDTLYQEIDNISALASTKCDQSEAIKLNAIEDEIQGTHYDESVKYGGTNQILLGLSREKSWVRNELVGVKAEMNKTKQEILTALMENKNDNVNQIAESQKLIENRITTTAKELIETMNTSKQDCSIVIGEMNKLLDIQANVIDHLKKSHDDFVDRFYKALKTQTATLAAFAKISTKQLEAWKEISKELKIANGKNYYIRRDRVNWADAQMKCNLYGGYLAELSNENERKALLSLINGATCWLGGRKSLGVWKWSSSDGNISSNFLPTFDATRGIETGCLQFNDYIGNIGNYCDRYNSHYACEFDF